MAVLLYLTSLQSHEQMGSLKKTQHMDVWFSDAKWPGEKKGMLFLVSLKGSLPKKQKDRHLGLDSPFFSTILLFKNQPFSREKDPWKEWKRKVSLEEGHH